MRASFVVALVCALFIGVAVSQSTADSTTSSAPSPPTSTSATSSSYNGIACIPDDAYGPSDDMLIYIGSSTGANNPNYYCGTQYQDVCYCMGQCYPTAQDVDASGNPIVSTTTLPRCSALKAASSSYYGSNTWSGLNVTQLIIVVVLVSVCGLFLIAAIIRAIIRTRKTAAAVAADEKSMPVIEVVSEKVEA